MKKTTIIGVGIVSVLFLVLIFFTFYGNAVYEKITPKVESLKLNQIVLMEEKRYCPIENTAFTEEGFLYMITKESGFSRTIYQLEIYQPADVIEDEENNRKLVAASEVHGKRIATVPEGLKEGSRVLIK